MSQLGFNAGDLLKQVAGASGGELVFRSQLTPEIRINLANLAQPQPSPGAVSSESKNALRIVKPEVIIRGLGVEKSIAPYGRPSPHFYLNILIAGAAMGLIGAGITWRICKAL